MKWYLNDNQPVVNGKDMEEDAHTDAMKRDTSTTSKKQALEVCASPKKRKEQPQKIPTRAAKREKIIVDTTAPATHIFTPEEKVCCIHFT